MSRFRRVLIALAVGFVAPIFPAAAHAGGGVGGGGVGGGGVLPLAGGTVVSIDHATPPGHNYGFLDFFPRTAVVREGETVTWANMGNSEPHTVTFLPVGTPLTDQALGRLFPGGGGPIPDTDDGPNAGPYFPFNAFQKTSCGNSPYFPATGACPWDGRTVLNSGFLLFRTPAPSASSFTARMNVRPGLYRYFCLVHGPNMSGFIRVVAPGSAVPSSAQQVAAGERQYQVGARNAMGYEARISTAAARSQGGHTTWTVRDGAEYGRVSINEFIPANPAIKAGDTVMWPPNFHTVTFSPPPTLAALAIECEAPGRDRPFRGSFTGCNAEVGLGPGAFPSGPPGRPYTGGLYNSGVLVLPKPRPWSASFPNAGTFKYVCLVHPHMVGAITVR